MYGEAGREEGWPSDSDLQWAQPGSDHRPAESVRQIVPVVSFPPTTRLWSILIPTLSRRQEKFLALLDRLIPDAEQAGDVEIVALHNDGEWPLPVIRQALMDDARGEYISYVDDDDMVTEAYVPDIATHLRTYVPDSVGFTVAYDWEGSPGQFCDIKRAYGIGWGNETVRDWTHLNPVRTSIARMGRWDGYQGTTGEDHNFRSQIVWYMGPEAYVPKVLYFYRWSITDSVQHELPPHTYTPRRDISSPAFRYHPWST